MSRQDIRLVVVDGQNDLRAFAFGLLLVAVAVAKFWQQILLVALAVMVIALIVGSIMSIQRARAEEAAAKRREDTLTAARADDQHRRVMRGDPRGFYGTDWTGDDQGQAT